MTILDETLRRTGELEVAESIRPLRHHAAHDIVIDALVDDVRSLQQEVRHLRQELAIRATVERARGIVMSSFDADAALALLICWSSVCAVEPRALAQALVKLVDQYPEAQSLKGARACTTAHMRWSAAAAIPRAAATPAPGTQSRIRQEAMPSVGSPRTVPATGRAI